METESSNKAKDGCMGCGGCLVTILLVIGAVGGYSWYQYRQISATVSTYVASPAFIEAVRDGKLEVVEKMLANGVDPSGVGLDGIPLLHHLALRGRVNASTTKIASLLVEHGCDVNQQDPSEGVTALHMAARSNNVELSKFLLDSGADLTIASPKFGVPFRLALYSHNQELITLYLEHGASPSAPFTDGLTPLGVAIDGGDFSTVDLLEKHGADLDAPVSNDGTTATEMLNTLRKFGSALSQ